MGVVVRDSHSQMECLANVTQMQMPMRKAHVALPLAIVEILLPTAHEILFPKTGPDFAPTLLTKVKKRRKKMRRRPPSLLQKIFFYP